MKAMEASGSGDLCEVLPRVLEARGGSWRLLPRSDRFWRLLEAPCNPEAPWRPPWMPLDRFKKAVIKLVFHFQFKYINGLKAVKILVDARERRV